MIKNYFKIACRNLWKNKGYSFLNIFGLAIGITCASFIFLWVEDEMSFDSVFADKELVFYVPTNQKYEGEWRTFYSTPGPLAPDLKAEIPEITKAARTFGQEMVFSVGDNAVNRYGRFADPDLFDIYDLEFLEGNATTAFEDKNAIVLTEETARLLFGATKGLVGEVIQVNNNTSQVIKGVIKDLPQNMSFKFTWLAPYAQFSQGKEWTQRYGSNFADTFVKLAPGSDLEAVSEKVKGMISSKNEGSDTEAILHPASDWHLKSKFEGGKSVGGRITYVRLFLTIAFIILFIACINFMNLSTARSEKRANEVGVRKALGSNKKQLIHQFLAESVVTASLATIVSLFLLFIFISPFNSLINKQLGLGVDNPLHWLVLLVITLVCGVLAGLYPAFYLSSFNPALVLKGKRAAQGSSSFIRKGLVVVQFTISILFIISTIVVFQQVTHVKNRELGFDRENLLKLRVNENIVQKFGAIKNELRASGSILSTGLSNTEVLSGGNNGSGLSWDGGINTEDILISFRRISPELIETVGFELVEGQGFSNSAKKDSASVLISQSFAELMGEGSPIGKSIHVNGTRTVIGVVKDFVYGDMYGKGDPVIFFHQPEEAQFLYIKTRAGIPISSTLETIEAVLKAHNPGFPFEYEFVDESFANQFQNEQLMGDLSQVFSILAIVISCLGLFGLSAFTTEQRRKEIGVRKVLGSSVAGIVHLLSKEFIRLVIFSILIALPLGWWTMSNWLQGFGYRTSLTWWVFGFAGSAAIVIAIATVSFQAIKAATANPIKSLRTE